MQLRIYSPVFVTNLAFFMYSALFSDAEIEPWTVSLFASQPELPKNHLTTSMNYATYNRMYKKNKWYKIHPFLVADVRTRHYLLNCHNWEKLFLGLLNNNISRNCRSTIRTVCVDIFQISVTD
jgi:hypothetical protein